MRRASIFHFVIGISMIGFISIPEISIARDYKLDLSHSNVGFIVRHLVSRVPGNFKNFNANFSFDPEHPEKSKVDATVMVDSINTDNRKRDDHLQSDDFFAAKKYPKMTFVSTQVVASEGKKYKMSGDLTMRGITKPVTFDVEFLGDVDDPWGGHRAGFTATSKINRKDFGINWNKTLDSGGVVVSDEVEINLNVEGVEKGTSKTSKK